MPWQRHPNAAASPAGREALPDGAVSPVAYDVCAASLGHGVVCGVNDTPFHDVSKFAQAFKDDGEVPSALAGGGEEQPVNILQQHDCGAFVAFLLEDAPDGPPEDTLFAFYALELLRVAATE